VTKADSTVIIGKVAGAHGVRGWLRVHCYNDTPELWSSLPEWLISQEAECVVGSSADKDDATGAADLSTEATSWNRLSVASTRWQTGGLLAQLRGVDDRDQALGLKGHLIAAPRSALPSLAEGEYYWCDLIGLQVINQDGKNLGVVHNLMETGANQVLQVRSNNNGVVQERLLPFINHHAIQCVDLHAGQINVIWQPDW